MDQALAASRFDWIAWLATIPGVPSGWGATAPQQAREAPHVPDDMAEALSPSMLKAA